MRPDWTKFSHLWTMVGNTPMIEILNSYQGNTKTIYAKSYLSTDLLKKEPVKEDYLSPHIELLKYLPLKRAFNQNHLSPFH